ncbi:MAG TPA: PhoH family protein [Rhabdochlamydiaceae bacterium]|nr:PhoH family protein [Rhabdochlamydiaceae bacterium]
MTKKTYVIDTNVLLHDPDAMLKFKDSDVVIPLAVLEELDSMKRNSDERGKNARQVIRFLNSLKGQNIHKGVELGKGIRLMIHDQGMGASDRKALPTPFEKNHHKLVVAYQIQETNPNVVFLSKDIVMRIKADAVGIASQDYENLKFSYDNLYRGYRRIEVPKTAIDLFYKDGFLPLEVTDLRPNEYCFLFSPERSSAVGKYNSETKRLEPLMKLARDIWGILPLNLEQKCALDLLLRDDIKLVTLVGQAGTGKTLLALAAALRKVFDEGLYSRILISRPIVPLGKDIGYLPGTKEEKLYHWMQPLYDNLEFLCASSSGEGNGGETKTWIMDSNKLEVEAVTYIRGRTLPKIYMIVDEAQNLTPHEVKTIISRAGQGTKVVLTGDPTQIDNPYLDKDSNALTYTVGKFSDQRLYGHMLLEKTERSELAALAAEIL